MYILIIITITLDFLISYFVPSYFNNLTLFYPMLTLTLIVFLYNKVDSKNYFKMIIITGILYDLIFSYIFLFHSLIFLMFGKMIKKVAKYVKTNLLVNIILVIIFIFLYDFILFLLVSLSNYSVVTWSDLLYKFENSLILNISFFGLLTIIFASRKKKNNVFSLKRGSKVTCKHLGKPL